MSSDPEAGRKLREAVERYALKQAGTSFRKTIDAVLHCFVTDERAVGALHGIVIDMVFRYLFAAASACHDRAEAEGLEFDDLLDEFLSGHTHLTENNAENFRKILKAAVLTSKADRPKSEVRRRLLEKQRRHRCYLCAEEILSDEERLDHVWPQSAGGGTGQSNLWRTHAVCQAAKHDLAVPADAPVGRFAYSGNLPRCLHERAEGWWGRSINDEQAFVTLLDDIRASAWRIALVLRQGGKCHECGGDFREIQGTNLRRLEQGLPWWFPNAVIVCDACGGD